MELRGPMSIVRNVISTLAAGTTRLPKTVRPTPSSSPTHTEITFMLSTFILALVSAPMIVTTSDVYRTDVMSGEPILLRLSLRNDGPDDLISVTGPNDPRWANVSLVRQGTHFSTSLASIDTMIGSVKQTGGADVVSGHGQNLDRGRVVNSFGAFTLPTTLPLGTYSLRVDWSYAVGANNDDGALIQRQIESGTLVVPINVIRSTPAGLAKRANELALRVRDQRWKAIVDGAFAIAAADALFSMSPEDSA